MAQIGLLLNLDPKYVCKLKENGFFTCDMHVHTYHSTDVLPVKNHSPKSIYEECKRKGMDFVTFTDHENMDAFDEIGKKKDLITGVELKILDRLIGHTIHFNVYNLNKRQFKDLTRLCNESDLDNCTMYLEDNALPFVYNHPFWFEYGEKPSLKAVLNAMKFFPAVEYNNSSIKPINNLLLNYSKNKSVTSGSDTHIGLPGDSCTIAKGDNFNDFFHNILEKRNYIVSTNLTRNLLIYQTNQWIRKMFVVDEVSKARKIGMIGINKPIDNAIRFLSGPMIKRHPVFSKKFQKMLTVFSNSGIIADYYLNSQKLLLKKFNSELNL